MLFLIILSLALTSFAHECPNIALIIVDVQNCFTEGGTLPVPNGNEVIPVINDIRTNLGNSFSLVVRSQDWHCSDHVSFASQHPGHTIFDVIELDYNAEGELCNTTDILGDYAVYCDDDIEYKLEQTLWPDHCVIDTEDANFHPDLIQKDTDVVVRKGYRCQVDSYSAFFDNGGFSHTELQERLEEHDIDTVVITGLATDFCTFFTAMDAHKLKYTTYFVWDATRGIMNATMEAARKEMTDNGITILNAADLKDALECHGHENSAAVGLIATWYSAVLALWYLW